MTRASIIVLIAVLALLPRCAELPTVPDDLGLSVRLVGIVKNAATGAPVAGAQLVFTQGSRRDTATSFNDGRYLILNSDFREGDLRVEVSAPGFNPFTATFRVVEDTENTFNIELTP